jgi:D-alanyl-D-alanine carboxypeptidase (penicillin-binding protein 5/6)
VFRRATHLLAALLAVFVTFAAVAPRARAAAQGAPPTSYIVVDADTGEVLAAQDEHVPVRPASTVKLMTALTAIERLALDAPVKVSELAAAQPASRISMVAGEEWPFVDALASLLMVSANDAAYAIAETVSGSLEGFAEEQAATARRYGMRDSTFADPAGLDDEQSFGGGPFMSVYDIAIAGRNALAVPQIAWFSALVEHRFVDPAGRERHLVNHNMMLPGNTNGYDGANGLKPGYTEQAGRTLAASATRNGRTLIAVVVGTYDVYGWAAQLLDAAFADTNATGTGARLPPVRVSPFDQRVGDREAFLALAGLGASSETFAAAPTTTTPAEAAAVSGTTAVPTTAVVAQGDDGGRTTEAAGAASTPGGEATSEGWRDLLSVRNAVIAGVVLLVILIVLRRRAVRRRRARRLAQRRRVAAAMRRGSLPVVDGRYRAGLRVGPPVESHVRIHPVQRPQGSRSQR